MKHRQKTLGFSEKKLLEFCSKKSDHIFLKSAHFWTAEVYGFGKYIRKYGYYPKFLPLAIFTDHGPSYLLYDKPLRDELDSYAPTMFYHSPDSVKIWRKYSKKPCFTLFSPFVFYRRSNHIVQDKDAKGTIVFPNHTVADMDEVSNTQTYIDQLKNLPKKFQPISVCLHYHDIKIGRHKIYFKNNIPVYTAGNDYQYFVERYYDILKKFKYASSNQATTSLYYAVEMGIPFFVYGNKSKQINKSNPNYPQGQVTDYQDSKLYQSLEKIFSGLDCAITKKKKKLTERSLGIYDGLGRIKMAYVLYSSLIKLFISKAFYLDVCRRLKEKIK